MTSSASGESASCFLLSHLLGEVQSAAVDDGDDPASNLVIARLGLFAADAIAAARALMR